MNTTCNRCGRWVVDGVCQNCGRPASEGRVWIWLGAICLALSPLVLISTHFYVLSRRITPTQTLVNLPSQPSTEVANINSLSGMQRHRLEKLLPAYFLNSLRNDLGTGIPDDLRVINEEGEEYLIALGSRAEHRVVGVFKLEGGHLSDLTKQAMPADLSSGVVAGISSRLAFAANGKDIEISTEIYTGDLLACPPCPDKPHTLVTLIWNQATYTVSEKVWKNEPYNAAYATARALDNRSISDFDRPLINTALDEVISRGFTREADELWVLERYNSKTPSPESAYFLLRNRVQSRLITVKLEDGVWQAIAIEEFQQEPQKEEGAS